jgi:hypothetical protein
MSSLSNSFCLFLQLSDKYQEFVTDSDREVFISILQEVEDWLYEDGEDETKGVYIAKLEELKKVRVVCCAEWLLLVLPLSLNKMHEYTAT